MLVRGQLEILETHFEAQAFRMKHALAQVSYHQTSSGTNSVWGKTLHTAAMGILVSVSVGVRHFELLQSLLSSTVATTQMNSHRDVAAQLIMHLYEEKVLEMLKSSKMLDGDLICLDVSLLD